VFLNSRRISCIITLQTTQKSWSVTLVCQKLKNLVLWRLLVVLLDMLVNVGIYVLFCDFPHWYSLILILHFVIFVESVVMCIAVILSQFLPCNAILAWYMLLSCVCPSITHWYCVETAEHRITNSASQSLRESSLLMLKVLAKLINFKWGTKCRWVG